MDGIANISQFEYLTQQANRRIGASSELSVFNVGNISQLGDAVIGGFEQANSGALPQEMFADLTMLRNTLAEGMTIEFARLCNDNPESPVVQSQMENFMTAHRRYGDSIPGYSQLTQNLGFEGF